MRSRSLPRETTSSATSTARACRDGARAAELRERSLRTHAADVVTGGDKHLSGDIEADAERLEELGSGRGRDLLELAGVDLDLAVELEPAPGEGPQHVTHGDTGIAYRSSRLESRARGDELVVAESLQLAT